MAGMDIKALEDGLRTWIRSVLPAAWNGQQIVIWGDQNAPKPGGNMVELRRGNPFIQKFGQDVKGKVNATTGAQSKEGPREIIFQVRAYNLGSMQVIQDLVDRMDDNDSIRTLFGFSLAVVFVSAVMNLTKLYSAQYKEVAAIDLRMRTHSLREGADAEQGVGYINEVHLERKSVGASGTEVTDVIDVGPAP